MKNYDHGANHVFRPTKTAENELGVTVKTYMKAEERARTQEKANKEALASPERFDQKKLCRDGNFLRKVEKTAHK